MEQQIRFCESPDGVRLAYAVHGRGPALVKVANWITHVEHDWKSPIWRHWWQELGRTYRVLRYDERGCGLSDRDPGHVDFDAFLSDVDAIVAASGLERFALLGISQGGALAAAYAARHPERVTHLVMLGGYARGRMRRNLSADQREEEELLNSIVRVGWGRPDPVFRRVFTTRFIPDATPEQMAWLDEAMRVSCAPAMAAELRRAWSEADVSELLPLVRSPTLVVHGRGDRAVPFEEGRFIASAIPGARLLPLETRNHSLLADEPAWQTFVDELHRFLGTPAGPPLAAVISLSARELEVLRLVSAGLTNDEIAVRLFLSVRTVERHLSNSYAKLRLSGKAARAAAAAYVARQDMPTN